MPSCTLDRYGPAMTSDAGRRAVAGGKRRPPPPLRGALGAGHAVEGPATAGRPGLAAVGPPARGAGRPGLCMWAAGTVAGAGPSLDEECICPYIVRRKSFSQYMSVPMFSILVLRVHMPARDQVLMSVLCLYLHAVQPNDHYNP